MCARHAEEEGANATKPDANHSRGESDQPSSGRAFGVGVVWALVGAVASQGGVFLSSIVAARLLGQTEFGKLAILQSSLATIAGLAGMGLGTTATKFVAECAAVDRDRAGKILGLCAVATAVTGAAFAIALIIAAPEIASLFRIPGLASQLRCGALFVFFTACNAFQAGALAGFSAFPELARIGLLQGTLGVTLVAVGAWSFGLTGAVLAIGLSSFSSWVQNQLALRRHCRRNGIFITYSALREELRVLSSFAVPAALSGCLGGLAITAASAILVRLPTGLQELARFNAANTIRVLILLVPSMVSRVSTPLLCRLRGADNRSGYESAFLRSLLLNTILAGTAACAVLVLGPWLLALYGRGFVEGKGVLGLLLGAAVAETAAVALFQRLYSHGRIWRHLAILVTWSILLLGFTWLFAPRYGARGLAGAYCISWCASVVLYWLASRSLRQWGA